MAIVLKIDYGKKLGLPQYSSHQFSVSLTSEVGDASQIHAEVERLYGVLQSAVDSQIVNPGYIPGEGSTTAKVNGSTEPTSPLSDDHAWSCSDKQRSLILDLVERHNLDKLAIENLAKERFGGGVRCLNKLQASGLIDELLERFGEAKPKFGGARNGAPTRINGYAHTRRAA